MPTYDYFCPANQRSIEVFHKMSETMRTWGDIVSHLNLDAGDTSLDAPVERQATGGQPVKASSLVNSMPPCQVGGGCGGCG